MKHYKILVYDIETILSFFLVGIFIPETGERVDFRINQYQNDLYKLVKFIHEHKDYYWIGYNNIGFDMQVVEYLLDNYEKWYDLTSGEITKILWREAQDVIDNQKYNIRPRYREDQFTVKQIDTPRIWHFFNENKRVSLKQLEFEMRAENIDVFDIEHTKESFSPEEVEKFVSYCFNDITYTYEHYLYTIGETTHPLYKGKNKIVDREIIMEETGLDCLNWDDVKIGAEWNRKDYCAMTGKKEWMLRPERVNHFFGKKFSKFFPNTAKFQGKELKNFVRDIGEEFVLAEKQEFKYTFNKDLSVTIAKGGIHSLEKARFLKPNEDEVFIQNDIGSQYPNALKKYGIYPSHLGKEWNEMLKAKIQRRLDYKEKYKATKDPKYNSLQEMGKLSLNGGAYGRLNTQGDWQQDPCAMLRVTMGCQLEILMIVEALILKDFHITSNNTDGWDAIIPKDRLKEYFETVKYYEEKIGNSEMGNVEFTEFEWMAQTSVNDYVAKKKGSITFEDGRVIFKEDNLVQKDSLFPSLKAKGDFCIDIDLHKNSSFRIIALAFANYFENKGNVEEYVNSHSDIFDFCARSNQGQTYHHKGYKDGKEISLPKLIRYYVAKDGILVKKIVRDDVDTGANDVNVQPADRKKKICNFLPKSSHSNHLQNVDRQWYIDKINETIYNIELGRKAKRIRENPNQIKLF